MKRETYLGVKDIEPANRPRERFIAHGAESLQTEELLAILLRTGRRGASVIEVAKEVLEKVSYGAYGLNTITVERLKEVKGIGEDKAVTVCAAIELGRRLSQLKVKHTYPDFSSPQAVAMYVMERLRYLREEQFWLALLTTKNKLIRLEQVSSGGLTSSAAEQRTIFRKAIEGNAAALVLIHNHPSGVSEPSTEDIVVTKILMEAGRIMGIPILDHVIVGDGEFTSLMEMGCI